MLTTGFCLQNSQIKSMIGSLETDKFQFIELLPITVAPPQMRHSEQAKCVEESTHYRYGIVVFRCEDPSTPAPPPLRMTLLWSTGNTSIN